MVRFWLAVSSLWFTEFFPPLIRDSRLVALASVTLILFILFLAIFDLIKWHKWQSSVYFDLLAPETVSGGTNFLRSLFCPCTSSCYRTNCLWRSWKVCLYSVTVSVVCVCFHTSDCVPLTRPWYRISLRNVHTHTHTPTHTQAHTYTLMLGPQNDVTPDKRREHHPCQPFRGSPECAV